MVHRLDDVVADPPVARLVFHQLPIERLKLAAPVGIGRTSRLKRGRLHEGEVLEGASCCLRTGAHAMADGTALHEDDWMMTILTCDRGGQPEHETRLCLPGHLLEAVRRDVVAFVDDEMAVVAHAIIHDALANHALNQGDVE